MNEFDNIPDDFWRKTFDGAEEQPPQRVWAAVERELDEDSKARVLPLWGAALLPGLRTLTWGAGAAASVALLLIGWWYSRTIDQPKANSAVVAGLHTNPETQSTPDIAQTIQPSGQPSTLIAAVPAPRHRVRHRQLPEASQDQLTFAASDNVELTTNNATTQPEPFLRTARATRVMLSMSSDIPSVDTSPSESVAFQISAPITTQTSPVSDQLNPSSVNQSVANPLTRQAPQSKALVAWTDAESAIEITPVVEGKLKAQKREKWASLSIMPGTYNPAVALASAVAPVAANAVYTNTNYQHAAASNAAIDSRSSRSMAYQLSAGVQLTERWSIESGVGYLTAQSTVESPAQVNLASVSMIMAKDAQATDNLFIDAIRSRVSSQVNTYASADRNGFAQSYTSGRYSSAERQAVSNDYQFVQVPVQVGYQLRPRKKLGLALIGGFLTNIFVRNTVANQIVVTSADDIYRSLSLAASLGARFRYRPSQHWSASLAGLYQPTLGSSTVSDSPVRSTPSSAGMSFGVDYHFYSDAL